MDFVKKGFLAVCICLLSAFTVYAQEGSEPIPVPYPGYFELENVTVEMPAEYPGMPAPRVDPGRPMIALTFDDGPSDATVRVLNALDGVGGKATFFVVGTRVSKYSDTIKRIAESGNELGNHTWNHEYLHKQSREGIRAAVQMGNDAICQVCGVTPVLVRPPGGGYNTAVLEELGAMGMSSVLWSVDPQDWKTRNTATTVERVLANVKDGDIVLMHDLYAATAGAAEQIIPELVRRGYQLVTVSELLEARGGRTAGASYSQKRPQ